MKLLFSQKFLSVRSRNIRLENWISIIRVFPKTGLGPEYVKIFFSYKIYNKLWLC